MLHLLLHAVVPIAVALLFYRPRWRSAALVMVATTVVDADHLLADPIYDPARCSIGFHPLHGGVAIVVYAALFAVPLALRARRGRWSEAQSVVHLVGLGLLIHMALDALDCVT
ncbi:MAG TPA: DUF6122 family protein [Longimicrobiales bacterium]